MGNAYSPSCPFCNIKQKKPSKEWKYSGTQVSRFHCKCGKFFNFYKGKKSNWTIPKKKMNGKKS